MHENKKHSKGTKIHRTSLTIIVSCADMVEGDGCVSGQDLCFVFVSYFLFSDRRGSGDNQQIELNVPESDSLT